MVVPSNAIHIMINTEINLPSTKDVDEIGKDFNISYVPILNSSLKLLMVMAGIKMSNNNGDISKNESKLAYPASNKLVSGITNSMIPETNK